MNMDDGKEKADLITLEVLPNEGAKVGNIYDTDTYAAGFQRGRIEYARLLDADKEKILYGNAKMHFARQFENV